MLLTAAMDNLLAQQRAEGLGEHTLCSYQKILRRLAGFLHSRGVVQVADVVAADLDAWCQQSASQGLARSTQVCYASTVHGFFRQCHVRGWTLRNPAVDLAVPDDADDDLPPSPLSEQQVLAIFAGLPRATVTDLRVMAHLELLYSCALRLSESLSLDVDDCDFDRRIVHVRSGKGGRSRHVLLMPRTLAVVQDYLAVRRSLLRGPDHGALLLDPRGRRVPETNVRDLFRRLNRYLPVGVLHIHPHLFRHSLAVHLLRGGADIRHVQVFLGHASLETTKIYLRMVPGHLKEVYDKAMPIIPVILADA